MRAGRYRPRKAPRYSRSSSANPATSIFSTKQIALEQAINDSPLVLGNRVVLLEDGAATYAAMFAAIRGARDHINLETYILEDDEVGQEFAALLLEQQARGVQVNVIYDSVGGMSTPKAFFDRLRNGGIAVLEFNPVNPLSVATPWLVNHRDHRKLLVVDGRIAFIGGINISSVYSSGSVARRTGKPAEHDLAWRDTDLQIEGPVVADLQKLFMETWKKQKGKPLGAEGLLSRAEGAGKDIVRAIGSTPDDPYSLMYLTLISAIGNSEREVKITQAYFVPDRQLLKALTDAAGARRQGAAHPAGPLRLGPDLPRGALALFRVAGGRRTDLRAQGALLHSKTVVIDGVWSSVGSSNLDWRSFLDNDEINAVILGRDFAAQMEAMFEKDLGASEAIDRESWESRSPIFRIKEWGARQLERAL